MKKFAMLMLYLVLVFALAACAGTDTTPQGSVSDTVTVTDMKGEVAIPANPQRIVDVAGLTEELLILDMKVHCRECHRPCSPRGQGVHFQGDRPCH